MNKFEYGILISAVIGIDKYKRSKEVEKVKVSDEVFFQRLAKYLSILYKIFELNETLPTTPSKITEGLDYVNVKNLNFTNISKAKNLEEYLGTISQIFECSKSFFDVQTNMSNLSRVLSELKWDFLVCEISGIYGVLHYRLLFSDSICNTGFPSTNIQKALRVRPDKKSPSISESVVQCYALLEEETYKQMNSSSPVPNPTFVFNKDDMSNALGVPKELVPGFFFVNCNNEALKFILMKNKKIFSVVLNGEGICRNYNCSSIKHFCPSSTVRSILKIQKKFTKSADFAELEKISEMRLLSVMDIVENLSQSTECFKATLPKSRSRSKSVSSRATSVYKATSRSRPLTRASSRATSRLRSGSPSRSPSRSPSGSRKFRSQSPVPIGSRAYI
jgi:hypothetical protein